MLERRDWHKDSGRHRFCPDCERKPTLQWPAFGSFNGLHEHSFPSTNALESFRGIAFKSSLTSTITAGEGSKRGSLSCTCRPRSWPKLSSWQIRTNFWRGCESCENRRFSAAIDP